MPAEYGDALSEREIEIVELVAEGLTNREIATRVYLSPNTVKVHLRNIFAKTGVSSRTELTVLAMQEGWIEVPGASTETTEEEGSKTSSTGGVDTAAPALSTEPPPMPAHWPARRWIELAMGALLALMVLLLPQRPIAQMDALPPELSPGTPIADTPTMETADGWQELPSLPMRRAGMGVVATLGKIYVIGGMTQEGTSNRVDIYTVETEDWQVATPRPLALGNVGAALIDNKILVPGGCDAVWIPSSVVHLYDIENDVWSEVSPLPIPLCAYALSTYMDQVYLFGGWDGQNYQAAAYVYTPENDTWEELTLPSEARAFGAAAALQDRIFYVGGYDGRREWDTCEMYFPESGQWALCESMIQPRGGLGLVTIGGRLQAIGGGWDSYVAFNERYDPATNRWKVMETPIVGKWLNAGLASWNGVLYAVGGWDGDYLNRTYRLEIFQWRIYIPTTHRDASR